MRKILTPWFLVLGAIISAQAMATEVVVLDELILGEPTFTDVESFSQDHHCLLQKQDIPERAVDTYNKIFLNPTLYKLQNCSLNLKRVKDIDLVFEESFDSPNTLILSNVQINLLRNQNGLFAKMKAGITSEYGEVAQRTNVGGGIVSYWYVDDDKNSIFADVQNSASGKLIYGFVEIGVKKRKSQK